MNLILLFPVFISFILTLVALPKWIRRCNSVGLLWEDMNKFEHPKNVASSGGIVVIMAFILGVLSYIAIKTYYFGISGLNEVIFALLSTILILAIVGLTDDLLGWRHGGLSIKVRLFLVLAASIPLVAIKVGNPSMYLPFLGAIDFGIIYYWILIPLGITGATTTYNFLAGFNGLEAGQGIIILSYLSLLAIKTNNMWLALIGVIMVSSLVVFYFYNRYPAKVFPGDILTYSVGALIAYMAIVGNFEKIAVFIFIPYIFETILKVRGKLKKQSFGVPQKDGSLEMPYEKIYGLTHLSIWILKKIKKDKKVYEKEVTLLIFGFQIAMCILSWLIFEIWMVF